MNKKGGLIKFGLTLIIFLVLFYFLWKAGYTDKIFSAVGNIIDKGVEAIKNLGNLTE